MKGENQYLCINNLKLKGDYTFLYYFCIVVFDFRKMKCFFKKIDLTSRIILIHHDEKS